MIKNNVFFRLTWAPVLLSAALAFAGCPGFEPGGDPPFVAVAGISGRRTRRRRGRAWS